MLAITLGPGARAWCNAVLHGWLDPRRLEPTLRRCVGAPRSGRCVLPDEVISEIRERVDMVTLVGEYVRLVKRGSNHVGLCPFHAEKTPSFNVSAAHKFFHCFGCKESGDAF